MANNETIWAGALVTLTCGSALYFGWRQLRYLRRVSTDDGTGSDRAMLRQSAIRRLIVSAALCVAGCLIAATYFTGLAAEIEHIAAKREQQPPGERTPLDENERRDFRSYTLLWIGALTLVGVAVVLIGVDMYFVRRHWTRRLDRLRDDRRAMLDRQLGRLRAERGYTNGYHHSDE